MTDVALETLSKEKNLVESNEFQLVTFFLGEEIYGVDILAVQEIIRLQSVTAMPQTMDYVLGVINLRGKVIPIIDLRKRFNLPDTKETKDSRIIVVDINHTVMGIIVDGVSKVISIPKNTVEPPSPIIAGIDSSYIRGVGKLGNQLLILLDLTQINDQLKAGGF